MVDGVVAAVAAADNNDRSSTTKMSAEPDVAADDESLAVD